MEHLAAVVILVIGFYLSQFCKAMEGETDPRTVQIHDMESESVSPSPGKNDTWWAVQIQVSIEIQGVPTQL